MIKKELTANRKWVKYSELDDSLRWRERESRHVPRGLAMKLALKATVAALALFAAAPASADLVSAGVACDPTRTDPDAVDCSGYWEGNLNSGSRIDDLNAALDDLVGGTGFDPDVVFSDIENTKDFFDETGGVLTFDSALLGEQIISIHFGAAGEFGGDVSVLYLFNFGSPTTSIDLSQQGFSNGILIGNGVIPEPATWAMMLMGFGAVGYAMRRRRKTVLTQVA